MENGSNNKNDNDDDATLYFIDPAKSLISKRDRDVRTERDQWNNSRKASSSFPSDIGAVSTLTNKSQDTSGRQKSNLPNLLAARITRDV